MVAAVVLVFVFIFCIFLLFHLVQQNRYNTATQLESIARSVREPLSSAILKGDIPEAEAILASIKPAGVVSRADVVLPNQFQALRKSFIPELAGRLLARTSGKPAANCLSGTTGGFLPYV